MLRISRLVCGLALVLLFLQAVPMVRAQGQDLIVDICTTPNKYWNKAVALKGHVVKVTPDPPGTNRGRYTLRDQSDKDIEIATDDLPAQGKVYIVRGVVQQKKAGDNVPIVQEDNRMLAQPDTPMSAAPAPAQPAPSAARTAAPAAPAGKGMTKAEIAETVRNEMQKAKENQPAPAPAPTPAPTPAPAPAPAPASASAPSMMENPMVIGGIVIAILAIAAIVILAMRKKPEAPAYAPPAQTQYPSASMSTTAAPSSSATQVAATQVSSGSATMVASKGTEVFTRLGGELAVAEGPDRGRTFVIGKPTTLIGRAGQRKNDLELTDGTASREQAKILYNHVDRSFKIVNESTTNPTRVNGSAVDAAVLQDGDRVEFGNTLVKFKKT